MWLKRRGHTRNYLKWSEVLTESCRYLATSTPQFKEKAIFLFDCKDQFRPEVQAFHSMVRAFKSKKRVLLITKETNTKPAYLSQQYLALKRKFNDIDSVQICQYNPHLGLIPLEISDIFPAAHHETARLSFDPEGLFRISDYMEQVF